MAKALPWPEGWHQPPFGGCLLTGLLLVAGVPLAVGGLVATVAGSVTDCLGVLTFGVLLVALAALSSAAPEALPRTGVTPPARDGEPPPRRHQRTA